MLIRKNTKAFKTIVEIVTTCQDREDRNKLIRLYITKAGHSIRDRISVEGIEGDTALFYEMNYQTVFNNLRSSNHQLHVSDDIPGVYFFHSTSNKVWDENPFEFDEAIVKEFSSLPELPVVRKKEKAQKFVLPSPKAKQDSPPSKSRKAEAPSSKKEKVKAAKTITAKEKEPKQPDFKLKHKIEFTDLEKVVFRQAQLNKEGVLNYYHKIAEYILPYLKDRPLWTRLYRDAGRTPIALSMERLFPNGEDETPAWIQAVKASQGREQAKMLVCNDKEHLLLYVEMGCLEFDPCHSKTKNPDSPDYILIALDSPESELTKAVNVALTSKEIFDGLQLPSFIKTDGMSGLHMYIPLDSKSEFEASRNAAEYICKLIALKIPDLVALKGADDHVYGKVTLDFSLNEEGKSVVAPYSLVPGQLATVATPLLWEEVTEGLRMEHFNHETIFKRLKEVGDPFETLSRKKVNADELSERLEENYAFLF